MARPSPLTRHVENKVWNVRTPKLLLKQMPNNPVGPKTVSRGGFPVVYWAVII